MTGLVKRTQGPSHRPFSRPGDVRDDEIPWPERPGLPPEDLFRLLQRLNMRLQRLGSIRARPVIRIGTFSASSPGAGSRFSFLVTAAIYCSLRNLAGLAIFRNPLLTPIEPSIYSIRPYGSCEIPRSLPRGDFCLPQLSPMFSSAVLRYRTPCFVARFVHKERTIEATESTS